MSCWSLAVKTWVIRVPVQWRVLPSAIHVPAPRLTFAAAVRDEYIIFDAAAVGLDPIRIGYPIFSTVGIMPPTYTRATYIGSTISPAPGRSYRMPHPGCPSVPRFAAPTPPCPWHRHWLVAGLLNRPVFGGSGVPAILFVTGSSVLSGCIL